ncbi:hypothetical protein BH23GEM9_BH23GEM9_02540 [soil metagenome]
MILVAGSTGVVGGEVCRRLLDQGHSVRALVRPTSDPDRIAWLREAGAKTVEGDLRDATSLDRVCAGVTAIISTATGASPTRRPDSVIEVDGNGQIALMDAALRAGVEHFTHVSLSGTMERASPARDSKRRAEARLRQSGMTWTVLRPSPFMEIWLSPALGFDVPNGRATVYGTGGAPISYVSLFDVAHFCVESLENPASRNATIEVGGPDAVTQLQAVRIAEELTGRSMQVQHVPVEALQAQYETASDPLQKSFAAFMLSVAEGDVIDMHATLRLFPVQLRTVRQFISESSVAPPEPLSDA